MQDVIIMNGLETRVSLVSFRLIFVEDTEDVFYRRGKLGKAQKLYGPQRNNPDVKKKI